MKKKIIICLLTIFIMIFALFALPVALREIGSRYAKDEDGKLVLFDTCVASHVAKVDRKMAKDGYGIDEKTVVSEDLMPYNGVNMRLLKVTNVYSRRTKVVSHGQTDYQRMISALEGRLGRLPSPFYALDVVKYEGERKEKDESAVVECRFMLIEDNKDRFFGGNHYAYAGSMKRLDSAMYTVLDEGGNVLGDYTETTSSAGEHFDGDLQWLKSKAYSNYVSPIWLNDAFEWYE